MNKTILVCDDDPYMLTLYRKILEKEDYNVNTCQRAENLFTNIDAERPDIIIVDLSMIGLGGESAVLMLKDDPKYSTIPVIISSGRHDIAEIAGRVKADAYLSKSSDDEDLLHIIESFLEV